MTQRSFANNEMRTNFGHMWYNPYRSIEACPQKRDLNMSTAVAALFDDIGVIGTDSRKIRYTEGGQRLTQDGYQKLFVLERQHAILSATGLYSYQLDDVEVEIGDLIQKRVAKYSDPVKGVRHLARDIQDQMNGNLLNLCLCVAKDEELRLYGYQIEGHRIEELNRFAPGNILISGVQNIYAQNCNPANVENPASMVAELVRSSIRIEEAVGGDRVGGDIQLAIIDRSGCIEA